MSSIIDGVLNDWGDKLFYKEVKGRKARNIQGGRVKAVKEPKKKTLTVRQQLKLTIKKAPEVMVKVTGGGKNSKTIKNHFDYISRNGDLEVENERGEILLGRGDVNEALNEWVKGRVGIPKDGERRREAFNVMLSMPPGTDRASVKEAARQFAIEQFSDHQYLFAEHRDEDHPHVHLVVKAIDRAGNRLNPRKADLQKWREHFADKLREQGITANATPRRTRGVTRGHIKQKVLHWQERDNLKTENVERNVESSVECSTRTAHNETVKAFGEIARGLVGSGHRGDKELAVEIMQFVRDLSLKTRNKDLEERSLKNREKGPDRERS